MYNRVGEKYGKLITVGEAPPYINPSGQKSTMVSVRCDCGTIKNINLNNLKRGLTTNCGCLHRNPMWQDEIAVKKWMHTYYEKNKEELKAKSLAYGKKNRVQKNKYMRDRRAQDPERIRQMDNSWRLAHPEEKKASDRKYKKENKEKLNEAQRERLKADIQFRIAFTLRTRLRHAIKNGQKKGSAVRDLGCTIDELKFYLEGQFQDGMNWDNWSKTGWHIDHKIPLSFFDLTNREHFLNAVNYTNLQPMWAMENLEKGGINNKLTRELYANKKKV